jgi:non-ribosomal peptide synthetase component E (peptide arylation enzyme)
MTAMPIIEHDECTQLALLPLPASQPLLLTMEEADQALETVEVVIEQAERLHLLALATRIRGLTMQAVKELEEMRRKAAQIECPMWQIEQAQGRALTPAREVRPLVRAYTKRLAKQTGQQGSLPTTERSA